MPKKEAKNRGFLRGTVDLYLSGVKNFEGIYPFLADCEWPPRNLGLYITERTKRGENSLTGEMVHTSS